MVIHRIKNVVLGGLFVSLISLSGCKEVVSTPQYIEPLYKTIYDFDNFNRQHRDSVMDRDSTELRLLMEMTGYNDEDLEKAVARWSQSSAVRVFTPAVDSVFKTLVPLENNIGLILENLSQLGLEIPELNYVAIVWGYKQSIVLSKPYIFIALNHFLGEDYEGYKSGFYEYEKKDKTSEQLPYALTEALISLNYPYVLTDQSTALSKMLYEGALIYIKLKVVPGATLASALGYTTDELEWLDNHYQQIWETMIGKDLIYSTSRTTMKKLVDPSPYTTLISPECPGRVGRYVGYRLILNYMENNAKTPVNHLLTAKFYNNPSELVLAQ